ncbi:hypothetical protein, partial [Escherichia coli]|uniref:hypothetical protein n=1 Tax=Escherichia coli TaxID=562 RepID=UPI001D0C5E2E
MRSWFCLIALLLPGIVFASGEVIIQPQSKGEVHFLARGLSSGGDNIISAAYSAGRPLSVLFREGANKQVISSQADSLIKISRIWADFFPANTSNQPI